jgi:hypothetical protein
MYCMQRDLADSDIFFASVSYYTHWLFWGFYFYNKFEEETGTLAKSGIHLSGLALNHAVFLYITKFNFKARIMCKNGFRQSLRWPTLYSQHRGQLPFDSRKLNTAQLSQRCFTWGTYCTFLFFAITAPQVKHICLPWGLLNFLESNGSCPRCRQYSVAKTLRFEKLYPIRCDHFEI